MKKKALRSSKKIYIPVQLSPTLGAIKSCIAYFIQSSWDLKELVWLDRLGPRIRQMEFRRNRGAPSNLKSLVTFLCEFNERKCVRVGNAVYYVPAYSKCSHGLPTTSLILNRSCILVKVLNKFVRKIVIKRLNLITINS